jgi:5'-methylthioadenosine phosphorylase
MGSRLDPASPDARAEIGVIGGSGLYELLDATDGRLVGTVLPDTPFGRPSDPLVLAEIGGRRVAFLPRHGADHRFPPHRIPYRENLFALHLLGVTRVLAPCAVGSLDPALAPGTVVVPDQLLDRTTGRERTFYDTAAVHIPFADPYCPDGRAAVLAVAAERGLGPRDGATMAVVEGPRFSTRAESRELAAAGAALINMTGQPEAALARELALCYTCVALVTDLDAGMSPGEAVTQHEVFSTFAQYTALLRGLMLATVPALALDRPCACGEALAGTAAEGHPGLPALPAAPPGQPVAP